MFSTSLSFRLIILLLPKFFMEVLHDGSSRIFSPSRSVHQDSFLRNSSFLHVVIRSEILSTIFWRWYYVILDNLSSCFVIHMLLRMRYFKSINLVVGVILCHISPKSLPLECCYLWCLPMIQVISLSYWWKKCSFLRRSKASNRFR